MTVRAAIWLLSVTSTVGVDLNLMDIVRLCCNKWQWTDAACKLYPRYPSICEYRAVIPHPTTVDSLQARPDILSTSQSGHAPLDGLASTAGPTATATSWNALSSAATQGNAMQTETTPSLNEGNEPSPLRQQIHYQSEPLSSSSYTQGDETSSLRQQIHYQGEPLSSSSYTQADLLTYILIGVVTVASVVATVGVLACMRHRREMAHLRKKMKSHQHEQQPIPAEGMELLRPPQMERMPEFQATSERTSVLNVYVDIDFAGGTWNVPSEAKKDDACQDYVEPVGFKADSHVELVALPPAPPPPRAEKPMQAVRAAKRMQKDYPECEKEN